MKRIALAVLLTVSMLHLHAQTIPKFDVKNLIATSPEAAMIGRFGDVPIGYYTGTADVSIPMTTVKEGGVEIPIVLRYHGSGIKVEDQASNVGLGWSLEPGGGIVQIVTGKNDATDLLASRPGYNFLRGSLVQGVYADRHEIGNAYFSMNCYTLDPSQMDDYQILDGMAQGMGQPDIYQYSFAGYSGKFYINPITREIVLMDKKSDIKFSGGNGGWVAKTMDGNTFYFYGYESASNYDEGSIISGQTAKLTKIELHNGKTINFGYQDGYYTSKQYSESLHSDYPLTYAAETNNRLMPNLTTINHQIKILTTITSDNDIISFNLEDRLDMPAYVLNNNQPVKRIGSVDIRNAQSGRLVKSYKFNYDYFNRSSVGGSYTYLPQGGNSTPTADDAKALKLLSVQEIGYTAAGQQVANPAYTFNYNESVVLPMKTSFAKDFWGYYNGQDNRKSIPDLNFFYLSGDPDYSDVSPNLLSSFQGANRAPDSTKMKAGILTRITYPTGGYTEFDYEPHNFTNYSYPDVSKSQQSIQSGHAQDNNQSYDRKSVSFTLPKTQAVTFNNSIDRGPVARTYMDMQSATIVLTKTENGITSTVRTWQMDLGDESDFNSSGVKHWQTSLVLPYIANGQYTITTYLPDEFGPQQIFPDYASVSSDFIYYIATETAMVSYGGGLRVSGIRNYLAQGVPSGRKVIKYVNADNTPSGILMTPVKPLYSNIIYAIQADQNGLNARADQKKVWHISSESSVPFSDAAQGNVVGYSRVEETELASDGTTKGKHVYIYNNRQSNFRVNLPEDPDLLNGMINTEEIYNNSSAVPIQKTTYGYSLLEISTFSGYKIESTFVGDHSVNGCSIWNNDGQHVNTIDYQHQYMLHGYPLTSNWYVLGSKATEFNNNGTTVSTASNYTYNAKGQMIRVDTYNSRNQKKTSKSLFPVDNPTDPMSASLISRNLYDHIQQQTEVLNDVTELSKSVVDYRIENDQAVQSSISHSYQQGSPFTEVTFDKYGPHETLQQFTKNGPSTCILWSYNYSKPIAEINNVSFATLESVLGTASIDNFAARLNPSKADIDAFLAPLASLYVTKYVYDPATGITSQTDPKGKTTYYEYDGLQRLLNIKNQDQSIVKNYEYHYVGSGNTQEPHMYTSAAVSRTFTRNNCTEGGVPGTYTYTIPAGSYTSTISQDDAQSQAQSAMNANGQAAANVNAICTFKNDSMSQIFKSNLCIGAEVPSDYSYVIPAGKYTSTLSLNDANAQARADLAANGQAMANSNGSCNCTGEMNRRIEGACETGTKVVTNSEYNSRGRYYVCTYHYEWSNGTRSEDLTEQNSNPCPVN